jgi:hypothetical protein
LTPVVSSFSSRISTLTMMTAWKVCREFLENVDW